MSIAAERPGRPHTEVIEGSADGPFMAIPIGGGISAVVAVVIAAVVTIVVPAIVASVVASVVSH
ncbi:hypothetical protein BJX96DRAFT_141037, partial [Aspergillus floccosus]